MTARNPSSPTLETESFATPVVVSSFINVKTVDDRTFQIPILSPHQTLAEFRQAVEHATGVPVNSQRLIHNGRLLFGEHDELGLEHGAYVHLAPIVAQQTGENDEDGGSTNDFEMDYATRVRLSAHISQLHGFAWLIVIYFSLLSWRLLMVILFEQDDEESGKSKDEEYLTRVLVPNFLTSLFGVLVGLYGLWTASHRDSPTLARKVRWYAFLVTLLAMFSFLSSLEYLDSNSVLAVFILQMMFWYCILQARITEHSIVLLTPPQPQVPAAVVAPVPMVQSPTLVMQQTQSEMTPTTRGVSIV